MRGATLRDHGGAGPPAVLVPSLINPPRILDLDEDVSLTRAIARMGRHALLLDWGAAEQRSELSVGGHVEELLLPLLRSIDQPVAVIGYCLGGTMAIAAANLFPVERVATLAAPWGFSQYPDASKRALQDMWRHSNGAAASLGALPMEVLQAAFWSLDPQRTVRKFAEFGQLDPARAEARRFVELEEWANEGEPLPYSAAKELVEELFGNDLPGIGPLAGRWPRRHRQARRSCAPSHCRARPHRAAADGRLRRNHCGPLGPRRDDRRLGPAPAARRAESVPDSLPLAHGIAKSAPKHP